MRRLLTGLLGYIILISVSYGYSVDTEKCVYIDNPQILNVKCGSNCQSKVCVGKIECNLGAGPVLFGVSCTIPKNSPRCPSPDECVRMQTAKYGNPVLLGIPESSTRSGGKDAHAN